MRVQRFGGEHLGVHGMRHVTHTHTTKRRAGDAEGSLPSGGCVAFSKVSI